MNKTALASALALTLGTAVLTVEAGTPGITGVWNSKYVFTMTSPGGGAVGTPTPPQDWVFDFDNGVVSISNTVTFYGSVWTAHDVAFTDNGDGTYSGLITPDPATPGLQTNTTPNMLFDWSVNSNIPVEIVWDIDETTGIITTLSTVILSSSTAFPGFHPAFNAGPLTILCKDYFVVTAEGEAVGVNIASELLSTCNFVDGAAVLDSYTQPTNGTVTDDGSVLTYLPNTGFSGLDSFTYTVKDNTNTATPVTVQVQVGGELQGNFTMLDSAGDTFGGTNDVVFTFDPSVDLADPNTFNTNESDNNFGKLTIESALPQPFNGFVWNAHHVRIFGPGDYAFDTGCSKTQLDNTGCPAGTVGGSAITMHVGTGQIGAHILFDWSSSTDIDVVNVWDRNAKWDRLGKTGNTNKLFQGPAGLPPHEDANWQLVSTDVAGYTKPPSVPGGGTLIATGDGLNGAPMVDGPFEKFYANFSYKPDRGTKTEVLSVTQDDTQLSSLNLYALVIGLLSLFGFRRATKK